MTVGPREQPTDLDEFLTRAVDRQIAEQRALRETLTQLREAVHRLAERPDAPAVDLSALESEVRRLAERPVQPPVDVSGVEDRLRLAVQMSTGAVGGEVRDLRSLLVPALERLEEPFTPSEVSGEVGAQLGEVREAVAGVAADVEGVAQALIDLNAGLHGWAQGVDDGLAALRDGVTELRDLALAAQELLAAPVVVQTPSEGPSLQGEGVVQDRLDEVERRMTQTVDLAGYLADQLDDLDRLMAAMEDLPTKLEGVVSQALRRSLTARAKLDREASTAMDEALATLEERVEVLGSAVERTWDGEEQVRKLVLGQVELSSRVESLYETIVDRLEAMDADRRRRDAALAAAIDRSASGKPPRAADAVKATAPRRRSAQSAEQSSGGGKPAPRRKTTRRRAPASPRHRSDLPARDDNAIS